MYNPCQVTMICLLFLFLSTIIRAKKHAARKSTKRSLGINRHIYEISNVVYWLAKGKENLFLELKYRHLENNHVRNHHFSRWELDRPHQSSPSVFNIGPHTPTAPSTVQQHGEKSIGHIFWSEKSFTVFKWKPFVKQWNSMILWLPRWH